MTEQINNSYQQYLERKKQREKMVLFLGKFTVFGGIVYTGIMVIAIMAKHGYF